MNRVVCVLLLVIVDITCGANSAQCESQSEKVVSRKIDQLLESKWKEAGTQPAQLIDDAHFMRRIYLDLTGVIPSVGEARIFLADTSKNKRELLVVRLLNSPAHATRLTNLWIKAMMPESQNRFRGRLISGWLHNHFQNNTPYNEFAKELLTYTTPVSNNPRSRPQISGVVDYYNARQLKPEKLGASTSRFFLGVQIECAQCHDHPFDDWKQVDFWGYAAFFAQVKRGNGQQRIYNQIADTNQGDVKIPGTEKVILPRFLDGEPFEESVEFTRREQLANWLTADENPYFAQATVNRVWSILFGYGIVDSIDDFGAHNPPSQPELLEFLTEDFIAHGYDIRRLLRILANTKAYQLSSEVDSPGHEPEPGLFSTMTIKSLSANQLLSCLETAACSRETLLSNNSSYRTISGSRQQLNQQFLAKFASTAQSATLYESGIPQALTLMNGKLVAELTDTTKSDLLVALIDSPFLEVEDKIEILFLATLSRKPTKEEQKKYSSYVKQGGVSKNSDQALGDLLWALINSSEFALNH